MTKARIAYDNFLRDATILAVSSEDPQFPAEYTQDDNIAEMVFRSLSCASAVTVDYDLESAKTYNYVILLGHRCTSGATIKVIGADDSAFSSGVVEDTLTYNGNNIRQYLSTARTKRYIRISVTDTSNPDGFIQFSVPGLFFYWQPERSFGPRSHGVIDGSEVNQTPSGAVFSVRSEPKPGGMTLTFKGGSGTDWSGFMAMFAKVGVERAFDLCMDYNSPNSYGYWVILTGLQYPDQGGHYDYWTVTMDLKEHA